MTNEHKYSFLYTAELCIFVVFNFNTERCSVTAGVPIVYVLKFIVFHIYMQKIPLMEWHCALLLEHTFKHCSNSKATVHCSQ